MNDIYFNLRRPRPAKFEHKREMIGQKKPLDLDDLVVYSNIRQGLRNVLRNVTI